VWIVCAVLAAVGFLPAIISRNLSLDKGLEIEYAKVRSDTLTTTSLEV
jgi:hypothetical protein